MAEIRVEEVIEFYSYPQNYGRSDDNSSGVSDSNGITMSARDNHTLLDNSIWNLDLQTRRNLESWKLVKW